MFICNFCKKAIGPDVRETRVVLSYRQKTYPGGYGGRDSSGREIERETRACAECALKHKFQSIQDGHGDGGEA